MTKVIATAGAVLLSSAATEAQTTWSFDKAHTKVEFGVTHLVISEVTGNFSIYDGTVTSPSEDFSGSDIQFTVDIASINTGITDRDNHLRSDDFFNAEKYPKMIFKSKEFKKISGNKYQLTGTLTIRDITKPVTFDVTYNGTVQDPWGNVKAGFKLKGKINRFDYGLKWNTLTELGGAVVGSDVEITSNVELNKGK